MTAIERLEAVRNSLQAARNMPRSPLVSQDRADGLNDGLDVSLRLIALEIQMAEADAAAAVAVAVQPQAASAPRHVPQPQMVERKCAWCKGPFLARAADVKRGWGKFCSKSCKASKQESRTGQYRALQEHDEDAEHGHVFDSGYFGHGQN